MDMLGNKWESEETDDEYDDEYIQNEVAPPEVNQDFIDNILKVKHQLYDETILSPELGTKEVHSPQLMKDYLNNVNNVYILALSAKKGKVASDSELNIFPAKSREAIKKTLVWIADYFSKNRVPDTIPYDDFINKSLHEYQFVQDKSFE